MKSTVLILVDRGNRISTGEALLIPLPAILTSFVQSLSQFHQAIINKRRLVVKSCKQATMLER